MLLGVSVACFLWVALRRRLTPASLVGAVGVGLSILWSVLIWIEVAGELPREFLVPSVVVHILAIVLLAGSLDSLTNRSLDEVGSDHFELTASRDD